jgi:hypothetical protein
VSAPDAWRGGADHLGRIEVAIAPLHPPAQVRAGGPALHADATDFLAARQTLADRDVDPGLVEVAADQTLAVVDQDQTALEMHAAAAEGDDAVGGGADRRALRRGQIDAVVRAGRGAVEDALCAPQT